MECWEAVSSRNLSTSLVSTKVLLRIVGKESQESAAGRPCFIGYPEGYWWKLLMTDWEFLAPCDGLMVIWETASLTVPRICTGTKCITGVSKIFQPDWNSCCVRDQSLARASHKLQSIFEPRIRMAIEGIKANTKHRLGYCFSHFWTVSGLSV